MIYSIVITIQDRLTQLGEFKTFCVTAEVRSVSKAPSYWTSVNPRSALTSRNSKKSWE